MSKVVPDASPTPLRRLLRWVRKRPPPAPPPPPPVAAEPPTANAFANVKASWEALAVHDPLWAIVSSPGKDGNRWDLAEFLATGEVEVRAVLAQIAERGVTFARGRALDFGAGVGRLTQALASHFERVEGVDIAAPMIDRARAINRFGDRVAYHLGDGSTLPFADGTFDFVFSKIVLQHVGIDLQRRYVREFVRVAGPGGLVVFQAPARARGDDRTHFQSPVATPGGVATIDMNVFPRDDVERTVHDAGARVLHVIDDASAGEAFESYLYVVRRPAGD